MAAKKSKYSITEFEEFLSNMEEDWKRKQKRYKEEGKNIMLEMSEKGIEEIEMMKNYIKSFKEMKLKEQKDNLYKK